MKTTASLSETMIAAAAAFRVSGRAKPRVLRRLLRFGADLAYVSAPDESIERTPAARWFYDNARMLEEACADALDALRGMKQLPAAGRETRALALCRAACAWAEGALDAETLEAAAAAWQEVCPLQEQELALLPLLARLALLETLASLCAECAQDERNRRLAEANAGARRAKGSDAYLARRMALLEETEDQGGMAAMDAYLAERHDSARQLFAREQARQVRRCLWVANAVTALGRVSAADWRAPLERLSAVHAVLMEDPAGVYPAMDYATRAMYRERVIRLARAFRLPQETAARKAVALCAEGKDELRRHVGFYLLDEGQPALWRELGRTPGALRTRLWLGKHAAGLYVGLITFGSLAVSAALFFLGVRDWLVAPALLIAGEGFRQLAGLLLHRLSPPKMLPRLAPDHLGEGDVLVAVPTLLCSREQALAMARHLSVLRLANPEKKLSYLLLADFKDGPADAEPDDADITETALRAIAALNEVWGGGFYYLHRAREWNAGEKRFMGRERKRGARWRRSTARC